MSSVGRYRNAHKLFDKTPKTHPTCHSSPKSETHIYSHPKRPHLVDPFEYFTQNDVQKSWASKISSLVGENRHRKAVSTFKEMMEDQQCPNFVTVLSVIKAVGLLGHKNLVCGIHGYAIKAGFIESEVSVVTALVGVYSSLDLGNAWQLFNETPNKDVVLWSAMVSTCVRNGDYVGAFKLLKEMVLCGMQPNHVTIASILPACADLAALNLGREIHGYSIKKTLYHQTVFRNSLVDMYSKCKNLKAAIHVFKDMLDKDLISWRITIRGCVENGSPENAIRIFLESLYYGCDKIDEYIILEVIRAYSYLSENCIRQGFHSLLLKTGFIIFVSVVTELIQVYAKFSDIVSSRDLFNQLKYKDIIAWSVMIAVYVQSDQYHKAFDLIRQMQLAKLKPNEFTFVSLLLACMSVGVIEIGESLHARITKEGYSTNTFLTSTLIDMYCKFGRTKVGTTVFDKNPTKDLICWSSMINGYGINGHGEEVLECFSNMLSYGIEPNDVVFISVLSACSHCGLEYEGWNWFHSMEATYGITPKLAHYACMVDMLSRHGNIEEAFEFVNNMPVEPDKRIWGALLAGCRNSNEGYSEISEFVAKKLISLDPKNTSYYVVLSNLYADQGRWGEVEKLRNSMDTKSLKKVMGYSTI